MLLAHAAMIIQKKKRKKNIWFHCSARAVFAEAAAAACTAIIPMYWTRCMLLQKDGTLAWRVPSFISLRSSSNSRQLESPLEM